jgi:hypothetical protein
MLGKLPEIALLLGIVVVAKTQRSLLTNRLARVLAILVGMWIRYIFILFCCLLICSGDSALGIDKKVLSPPKWIEGSWSNHAESNADHIDTYNFSEHEVIVQEGFFGKQFLPLIRYGQAGFTEESNPNSYRIVLNSKKG